MKVRAWTSLVTLAAAAAIAVGASGFAAKDTGLRAGAARVDITPPLGELVAPFNRVGDKIYVRALVLDNAGARAVIVVADVPTIEAKIWADLAQRISKEAGVPVENILLGTNHTHNTMRVDKDSQGLFLPGSEVFARRVVAATLQAVREAGSGLQPAKVGYGAGKASLVANRNEWLVEQRRFIDGIDRTGREPMDQSLGVLKVETLSGVPIALVLNYGIEPVVNQVSKGEISGDVPGAAARYIEDRLGGKAVALFTIGAAGSPVYRVNPDPVYGQADPHVLMNAMGVVLGEEALATAKGIRKTSAEVKLGGAKHALQCPGKITTPLNLPNQCAYTADSKLPACVFKDVDADPVTLRMGLLKIGDVAYVQADGNITPALALKLRQASPLTNTSVVALTYGPIRYVMDDAAYPLNTYEATASRAKQGCAEEGFINGALEMINKVGKVE